MDNLTSSPQLVFPNVPDDFCPSGNWTEVFQAFVDEVLVNGTINVPGLGDVTPAQITSINDQLQSQQNQIDALDTRVDALEEVKIQRGVVTGVGSGDQIESITFSPAFTNSNYSVALTPIIPSAAGGIGTNSPTIGIRQGTKSSAGFSISIQNNGTGTEQITSIEWMAIKP
jgi:hypothetical protein